LEDDVVVTEEYEYLFESPMRGGDDPMGLAVFRRREG